MFRAIKEINGRAIKVTSHPFFQLPVQPMYRTARPLAILSTCGIKQLFGEKTI
jgi:hypothetical protein